MPPDDPTVPSASAIPDSQDDGPFVRYDKLGRRIHNNHYRVPREANSTKNKPRDAQGRLLRNDGKLDMRTRKEAHRNPLGKTGLIRGWPDGIARKEAKKAEREAKATTRDGILEILREIAADPDMVGSYRNTALGILLNVEESKEGARCWKCRGDLNAIPPSVKDWIDSVGLDA